MYNEIIKNWVAVRINEVSEVNPQKPVLEDDVEITFLPMSLVEAETGIYHLKEKRKYAEVKKGYTGFIEGDVLFAKITPCMENGKVALVNKLVNSIGFGSTEFHVVRPSEIIDGKYLFSFLVQRAFRGIARRNMTGSAGQLRVPKGFIENSKIPLAPLPEQRAIVAKIEQLFSELDNGITNLKAAKAKLVIHRQAVLKKAFEGELTKTGDIKWISLGEVCDNVEYGTASKSQKEGLVPVLRMGNIQHGKFDWSDLVYTSDSEEIK